MSEEELKRLLRKYGTHLYECPKGQEDGAGGEGSARMACTCGFYRVQRDVLGLPVSTRSSTFIDEVDYD